MCRATSQSARLCGYRQRNREVLDWARRKRRLIRRDDLIAMLVGWTVPVSPPAGLQVAQHGHHIAGQLSPGLSTSRSPLACAVSGAAASTGEAPFVASFVDSMPGLDEEISLVARRRGSLTASDENQLWEGFRSSSRKRPPSADNFMGSPKRSRFA